MSFWHWYNMETNYDGGNVKVSTDGGTTFQVVTPARGYDGIARSGNAGIPGEPCFTNIKEFWQEDVFDLSAFAGQSVIIRFHFGSDGSVQRSGWYVDDVRLRSSDVDDVAPSITNVVVPASTFDTAGPYTVSADVKDLFSGVDGVSMFYSLNGGSFTEVAMTQGTGDSWSADIPGPVQRNPRQGLPAGDGRRGQRDRRAGRAPVNTLHSRSCRVRTSSRSSTRRGVPRWTTTAQRWKPTATRPTTGTSPRRERSRRRRCSCTR